MACADLSPAGERTPPVAATAAKAGALHAGCRCSLLIHSKSPTSAPSLSMPSADEARPPPPAGPSALPSCAPACVSSRRPTPSPAGYGWEGAETGSEGCVTPHSGTPTVTASRGVGRRWGATKPGMAGHGGAWLSCCYACHNQSSGSSTTRNASGCSTGACPAQQCGKQYAAACESALHTVVGVGRCVRHVQQHPAGALKILLLLQGMVHAMVGIDAARPHISKAFTSNALKILLLLQYQRGGLVKFYLIPSTSCSQQACCLAGQPCAPSLRPSTPF